MMRRVVEALRTFATATRVGRTSGRSGLAAIAPTLLLCALLVTLRSGTGCTSKSDEPSLGRAAQALVKNDAGPDASILETKEAKASVAAALEACPIDTLATDGGTGGARDGAAEDGGADAALDSGGDAASSGDGGTEDRSAPDAAVLGRVAKHDVDHFDLVGADIVPRFVAGTDSKVDVKLPASGGGRFHLSDRKTGLSVRVALMGARPKAAERSGSDVVYRGAGPTNGDVIHRPNADGAEDFVVLPSRPSTAEIIYDVELDKVAGLRLVGGALEFLDATGDPRLRVRAPVVRGANCRRVEPTISVDGCAVSTDPFPPWGRALVQPGAASCRVKVSFDDQELTYPVVVDPTWSGTTMLTGVISAASSVVVPNDIGTTFKKYDVIVAGGSTDSGPTSASQVFRWTTGTWATVVALPTPRQHHTMTLAGTTKIVVAGGENAAAERLLPTPLLDLSNPTAWTSPTSTMAFRRVGHRAVVLSDARVVVTGGEHPAFSYRTEIEVFTPATETWATNTAVLSAGRMSHATAALADNRVLVAGGWNGGYLSSTETILLGTAATAPLAMSETKEWMSAIRLPNGNIMIPGGSAGWGVDRSSVQVYVPGTGAPNPVGTWLAGVSALPVARTAAGLALIGTTNGRVLLAGGFTATASPNTTFHWEAGRTPQWVQTTPDLSLVGHGFPVMASGGYRALIAGGYKSVSGSLSTTNLSETLDFCDECDDGNRCTTDTCTPTGCTNPPVVCADSDVCNGVETCNPTTGQCNEGTPLVCADANPCTINGNCNPASGCSYPPEPTSTLCPDALFCNGQEHCDGAANCVAGTPPATPPDGNPCTDDVCKEATDELYPANTAVCDDGNVCTSSSACSNKTCSQHVNVGAGTSCDDANVCNGSDTCNGSGTCSHGVTATYPADVCFVTTCSPATGVTTTPKSPVPPECAVTNPVGSTDPSVATDVEDLAKFLYTTAPLRQTGVIPGTFNDPDRLSIISGRVLSNALGTQSGVLVKVIGHPEFGETTTLNNGHFDIAVNGGATYLLSFSLATNFEVQRRVSVDWQDWNTIDDVVLTTMNGSTTGTTFALPVAAGTYTLVQSPTVTPGDGEGARNPSLILPPGCGVVTPPPSGLTGPFNVGFSEYTVDVAGRSRMPGDLPPASAYTYALELRLSQTVGGVETFVDGDVTFTPAATPIFYVRNFVDFPVGKRVPAGSYDRVTGAWLASDASVAGAAQGRVVQVASGCSGGAGTAVLDTDGNTTNDANDSCLPGIVPPCADVQQIAMGERQKVCAAGYANGDELWRIPMRHFTPWDANWGFGPPAGAAPPKPASDPNAEASSANPDPCVGSIIGCQNQSLGEELPVAGTPYKLRYQSERQAGRLVTITVPITGVVPSPAPARIDVVVRIAGRLFRQSIGAPFSANQSVRVVWDRLDAMDRVIAGSTIARVEVGNVYTGNDRYADTYEFGYAGSGTLVSGNRAAREIVLWKNSTIRVDGFDVKALGLGGWSLDVQHHVFDLYARILYLGDGRIRRFGDEVDAVISNLTPAPPPGESSFIPNAVAVLPDGSVGVSNTAGGLYAIWKYPAFGAAGSPVRIAGNRGGPEFAGDLGNCTLDGNGNPTGTLATAQEVITSSLTAAPDGSFYAVTGGAGARLRRIFYSSVGAAGWYIETIAGTGLGNGTCVDSEGTNPAACNGVLGRDTRVSNDARVTLGGDGAIYLSNGPRIRRFVQDKFQPSSSWVCGHAPWVGATIAGNVANGVAAADGVLAANANLNGSAWASSMASDGSLYFGVSSTNKIWAIEPSGRLRWVGGTGFYGNTGDGGAATAATFSNPRAVLWSQGNVFVLDRDNSNLRIIDRQGLIHAITGSTGTQSTSPASGVPALAGRLWQPEAMAAAPDGTLYVADSSSHQVRIIRPSSLPGCTDAVVRRCLPSEDGTEVYGFDIDGRHRWTKFALGGQKKYEFTYSGSKLASVVDATGNTLSIAYDGATTVTFTAPFGDPVAAPATGALQTSMTLTNGYATQVRYLRAAPSTYEDWTASYSGGGLLTTFKKPGNAIASVFAFDALGRLTSDKDPTMTGATTLGITLLDRGRQVALRTPENHVYAGKFESLATGGSVSSMTDPAGMVTTTTETLDGFTTRSALGGTHITSVEPGTAGPRFGMLAPENVTHRTSIAASAHQLAIVSTTTTATTATVPGDVFSTTSITEATTRGGTIGGAAQTAATWTTVGNILSGVTTYLTTSPVTSGWTARSVEKIVDAKGRVSTIRVPNYPPRATPTVLTDLTTKFDYQDAMCSAPPVFGSSSCGGRLTAITISASGETPRVTSIDYAYGGPSSGKDPGFASAVVDPEGYRATFGTWNGTTLTGAGRDAMGRVTTITRSRDATTPQWVTDVGYDFNGNVNALTPPGTPTHAVESNGIDLLKKYQPPGVGLATNDTTYLYNQERALTTRTEPWDGATRSLLFGYDAFGRQSTTTDPIAGTTLTVEYDSVGRRWRHAITGGAGAVTLEELFAGRLPIQTTYSQSITALLLRTYDHAMRVTNRTVKKSAGGTPYPAATTYALDGSLSSVRLRNTTDTADLATLAYTTRDGIGALTAAAVTRSDGSTALAEVRGYNGFGEPKTYSSVNTTASITTPFYDVSATTRDKLGRITSITETVAAIPGASAPSTAITSDFTYDEAGRLKTFARTGIATTTYTYDANGNRLLATDQTGAEALSGTFDAQDRILTHTRAGTTTGYTHTNNGGRINATTPQTNPTVTQTTSYDLQGNLRTYAKTGLASVSYVIDGLNRRVAKLGGTGGQQWLYDDQLRIAAELDGAGAFTHVYAYGERSNVPELVYQPVANKTYRIVSDLRGSVRLVLELGTSGAPIVRQRIDYDAWGVATEYVNADATFKRVSLGYAGGLWDRDTGLVRFGARDYDPNTGRWTSKDPIRFGGGLNLYAYVGNDPVNFVDPRGRMLERPVGVPDAGDLPNGAPWWHQNRNMFNRCPPTTPATNACGGDGRSWNETNINGEHKFRADDGSECHYDDNDNLVPDASSFNYCSDPYTPCHIIWDVIPHFMYGGQGGYVPWGR